MDDRKIHCEVCNRPATRCCALDGQPMLNFCREHYIEHARQAHGVDVEIPPPKGHVYVQCEICGERALLSYNYRTRNREGKRVTVRELLRHESIESCGPWRCPRHRLEAE